MKRYYHIVLALLFSVTLVSCDEKEWLKEKPLDFYTPDNSYVTTAQFREALNYLYNDVRDIYWNINDYNVVFYFGDIAYGGTDYPDNKFNNFKAWLTPTTDATAYLWKAAYNAIGNANVILNRLTLQNSVPETDQKEIKGEALFFRAFFYRLLANFYGDVPLVLEEVSEPRRDYTQATQHDIYKQTATDLEEASSLLTDIQSASDGQVNRQAAQHLLSEIYISLGEYQKAIDAASAVINHSGMALMTKRFGSKVNDVGGNPYWDLFQADNQDRSSGNTETILALQFEYQNSGSSYGCLMPRYLLPEYYNSTVEGENGSLVRAFTTWTGEKGGRGIGVIHPTDHFLHDIWGKDTLNDYRCSEKLIVKDFKIDNPEAKGFGQWLVKDKWLRDANKLRQYYPFIMKFSRVGYFPAEAYSGETTALGEHQLIKGNTSNFSYKDEYLFRLAGTYLLRAEAYMDEGQLDLAAQDINTLRDRAHASHVAPNEVNMNLILDEQMRELYFEDFRVQTLFRMGKFVERSRKYNPTGYNVGDYQNLLPIPYSEIERNIFGKIKQNPGYE